MFTKLGAESHMMISLDLTEPISRITPYLCSRAEDQQTMGHISGVVKQSNNIVITPQLCPRCTTQISTVMLPLTRHFPSLAKI